MQWVEFSALLPCVLITKYYSRRWVELTFSWCRKGPWQSARAEVFRPFKVKEGTFSE